MLSGGCVYFGSARSYGVPCGAGQPASPSSSSGGSSDPEQRSAGMDMQRALALVSDHYRSRNVSVSPSRLLVEAA